MDALSEQPNTQVWKSGEGFRRETSQNIMATVWAPVSELWVTVVRSSLLVVVVKVLWCQEVGGGKGTRTGYLGDGMTSEMSDVSGREGRVHQGQDTRAGAQGFQRKSRRERESLRQGDDTQPWTGGVSALHWWNSTRVL